MTALPFSRPLTRADLEDLPDDGHRDELLDGVLLVSRSPPAAAPGGGGRALRASGAQEVRLERPFPLVLTPAALLDA